MQNNNQSIFGLSLTQKLKDDFKTASTWAIISSVVSFVSAAITLFVQFSIGISTATVLIALFTTAISVMLNIFLFNFGRKINTGINEEDQDSVNEGLNSLRLYFMVTGIVVIVVMAILLLAIVITALAVGTKSF